MVHLTPVGGTFSGTIVDGMVNVDYSGMDMVGDSCDLVGQITATGP